MRPPHNAAENYDEHGVTGFDASASMRPPHNAAENATTREDGTPAARLQ